MSMRYQAAIIKPGFNPLGTQTSSVQNTIYGAGNGYGGVFGDGTTTTRTSPSQVTNTTNWSKMTKSWGYWFHAIKSDGTLWGWGYQPYGQLGIGNTTSYSSPKQVGALTNWSSVVAGNNHTIAIKTDGTLWSWGYNADGQLGLGNQTYYSSPKQVGSGTTWSSVSAGTNFSIAIKTDGTIWSCGAGSQGALGTGSSSRSLSFVQIGALTTWLQVACGYYHVMALKTDGTLWGWGQNNYGQLGLGNSVANYSSPKQVGALTSWLNVSAGGYPGFTLALRTNNALWSWGRNNYGQLGLGNTTNYSSPKQVGALTNWKSVNAGFYTALAIKTDNTLWGWGYNSYGNTFVGNNAVANYSSPVQSGSATNWYSVTTIAGTTFAMV